MYQWSRGFIKNWTVWHRMQLLMVIDRSSWSLEHARLQCRTSLQRVASLLCVTSSPEYHLPPVCAPSSLHLSHNLRALMKISTSLGQPSRGEVGTRCLSWSLYKEDFAPSRSITPQSHAPPPAEEGVRQLMPNCITSVSCCLLDYTSLGVTCTGFLRIAAFYPGHISPPTHRSAFHSRNLPCSIRRGILVCQMCNNLETQEFRSHSNVS